jgi:hypothetical protein
VGSYRAVVVVVGVLGAQAAGADPVHVRVVCRGLVVAKDLAPHTYIHTYTNNLNS